jgi:hypothetical protein
MRRRLAVAAFLPASLAAGAALACGAGFGPSVVVDPHQDIIVSWKDGVETYVFQPTFCGAAADFGLILPVPAQLSREPALADQQAFTKAAALSEPRKEEMKTGQGFACASGGSLGGMKNATVDPGPAIVASGRVGFLDWTQLKATTTASFTDWLTANGYPYSDSATSAFAYYVSKGWYFLAFRISQQTAPGGGTICQALGPVALSFPSTGPVIPSRMASAGAAVNGTSFYSWRIFGLTRGDAQLGFGQDASSTSRTLWYSGAIAAADAASFGGLAEAGDRLTRLTITFYSNTVDPDVGLALAAPTDYRGVEYITVQDDSACSVSGKTNAARSCLVACAGVAWAGMVVWRRRRRGR